MGKAADSAEDEPFRSSPTAGRKASQPYHLRFVDAENVDPAPNSALNDDADPSLMDDRDEDWSDDRAPLPRKPDVDVDDLLSTPRYVNAKALKRSTQAEFERIERERRNDQFASYEHAKPPAPSGRNRLAWSLISLFIVTSFGAIVVAVFYSDQLDRGLTSLKSAIFGTAAPELKTSENSPANMKAPAQAPAAPTQPQATGAGVATKPVTQQQAATQSPVNNTSPLAKSLFELGALSCIARANQISKFLSNGNEAIVLQKPIGNPDASLLMATMLPTTVDKSQGVSIVSLAPNQASGCEGNYQSIRVIEKPCPNAVAEMYGAAKALTAGTSGISIVPLNQFGRVFAIPAGNTCVMIKQELVQ